MDSETQAWPLMRTASTKNLEIRSPIPDVLGMSIDGGICMNVIRLERSAERLSQTGSVTGLQILNLDDDRNETRRMHGRVRGESTSSYTQSFANWNEDSPPDLIGSPAISFKSGSWSYIKRTQSNATSNSTRPQPFNESRAWDLTQKTPQTTLSRNVSIQDSIKFRRRSIITDSGRDYSASMASSEIVEEAERGVSVEQLAANETDGHDLVELVAQNLTASHDADIPERPSSSETFRQASSLFKDFDGVHYTSTQGSERQFSEASNLEAEDVFPGDNQHGSTEHNLPISRMQYNAYHRAPPANMVYYPAPVPRMLNLPQKLSKKPVQSLASARRSQMMLQPSRSSLMQPEITIRVDDYMEIPVQANDGTSTRSPEHSAPNSRSGSPVRATAPQQRKSIAYIPFEHRVSTNLDPRHTTPSEPVQLMSDSVVATLDSILEASAKAPVNVFIDHPFAGSAGGNVYARDSPLKQKRSSMSEPSVPQNEIISKAMPRSHESEVDIVPRRNSVMNFLTDLAGYSDTKKLDREASRASLGTFVTMPDSNKLSTQAEFVDSDIDRLGNKVEEHGLQAGIMNLDENKHDLEDEAHNHDDYEADESERLPAVPTQPSTLLAELQQRKMQQKSRSRTAATAYPNGMHSTLLQLDAVAQVESKKRKNQKVNLAWEIHANQTPGEQQEDEDDVPLAVLYPAKSALEPKQHHTADRARPMGLLERKQMEDNEPLSKRRNRLLGIHPEIGSGRLSQSVSQSFNNQVSEDPDEDIPLAERARRIKQKAALDAAIKDVVPADNKSTFEAEVLTIFNGHSTDDLNKMSHHKVVDAEGENDEAEETLGQRRARLQREKTAARLVRDPSPERVTFVQRPVLRQSMSLANLLASTPLTIEKTLDRRNITSPAPPGSLLSNHLLSKQQSREELRQYNSHQSSYLDQRPVTAISRSTSDNLLDNVSRPFSSHVRTNSGHVAAKVAALEAVSGVDPNPVLPSSNQIFTHSPRQFVSTSTTNLPTFRRASLGAGVTLQSYPSVNFTPNSIIPGYNNVVPGYNNVVPGYNNVVPGYNNVVPGYNNVVPGYNNVNEKVHDEGLLQKHERESTQQRYGIMQAAYSSQDRESSAQRYGVLTSFPTRQVQLQQQYLNGNNTLGMGVMGGMEQYQRAAIDRWRSGVA